jgi:hypothetical protein
LTAEWPLLAQTLGLGYTTQWTRQHRYPAAAFTIDDQAVTATAIPGAGLADYQRAATYLADTWGCVAVRAEQQGPGLIRLRGLFRDPLLTPARAELSGQAPASLAAWWLGWAEDASPVLVRLAEVSGIVVAGLAGFGKTMLVAHLLGQLAPSPAVQLVLVDGKGGPDYDHLTPRAWLAAKDDLTDVREVLRRVHQLMGDRQAAIACAGPACLAPPLARFTADLLERAVRQAAATVTVPCPALDTDQAVTLTARWGEQLDVRQITIDDGGDEGALSAEQVAGYVAKYATKATEALGVTLNHRITAEDLEELDVPAHVAELVRACFELANRPSLAGLRLRKWAHMLGFGGHFSTKSRRYSTTLRALRQARVAYAVRRRHGDAVPLDAWGRPEDDRAVTVLASWTYLGRGYESTGEAWLAASAAARAREARRIAREELRSITAA